MLRVQGGGARAGGEFRSMSKVPARLRRVVGSLRSGRARSLIIFLREPQ